MKAEMDCTPQVNKVNWSHLSNVTRYISHSPNHVDCICIGLIRQELGPRLCKGTIRSTVSRGVVRAVRALVAFGCFSEVCITTYQDMRAWNGHGMNPCGNNCQPETVATIVATCQMLSTYMSTYVSDMARVLAGLGWKHSIGSCSM